MGLFLTSISSFLDPNTPVAMASKTGTLLGSEFARSRSRDRASSTCRCTGTCRHYVEKWTPAISFNLNAARIMHMLAKFEGIVPSHNAVQAAAS
eukprot:scaffold148014_cov18-Tisochrysis_lutea.AAC.1